jgi:tetratricopeptide (TPR) repeat protein
MGLKANLRTGVAAICIVGAVAPSGLAETPGPAAIAAQGPLVVRVAQAGKFSRIEFSFPGAKVSSRREGPSLILRFSRYAKPDMSRLRIDPPKWLKSAQDAKVGGGLELTLTLADGADAKVGAGDGGLSVNLFEAPKPDPATAKAPDPAPGAAQTGVQTAQAPAAPSPTLDRPSPVPDSGVVKMQTVMTNGQLQLRFPWKRALGAAVFRRGEAVWVVFDAKAKIDLSGAPHGFRQATAIQAVDGRDFSAVRIASPSDVGVAATAEGALWIVTLAPNAPSPADPIKIARDESSSAPALTATVAGSTKVVWFDDPVVGDRIAAVTALAPAKALPATHTLVDLTLLRTVQGLVVQPGRDDLTVATDGDLVSIGSPKGLFLSPRSAHAVEADNAPTTPQPTSRAGLIDFENWPKTGNDGFIARYDKLQAAAAAEISGAKDESVAARMGLARFLVGSELSFEAIGVLNMTAKAHQNMLGDAEFRGLRGAARVMAGRYKEAEADFSSPTLADDPASSLWRGYIAAQLGEWAEARAQFDQGAPALDQFAPKWRARFARADAESALQLGQYPVADAAIATALSVDLDPVEQMSVRLVQARLFQAEGKQNRALRVFDVLSGARQGFLSAPALLHATQIRMDQGQITPSAAAEIYDSLRYRWRGDATELDTIRALGQIYISLGRYREALEALRSAGKRLPDLPQAVQLQADLTNAFRSLFLDGQADGLQPIQALALFYDFKELTPVGADGDLMVRRLARRLVDVDLLTQAAELLKYQADNRLEGVPKAEVSTDLAMIDLMNRRPQDALQALNSSRTTLLPTSLNAQRRVIEARAWLELGQYDHALELLEADKSDDAQAIRADVAWKQHDWEGAGGMFEKLLGDRWKIATDRLTADEESKLLRAGIAYSLAGDEAALSRLHDRYQGFITGAAAPEALKVALTGMNDGQIGGADFTRAAAESDSFVGWVQAMKQRLRDQPAVLGAGPKALRTASGTTPAAAKAAAPSAKG